MAAQIQEKYQEERAKRVRPDGLSQYIEIFKSDKFKHFRDDPWVPPEASDTRCPALTDGSSCKYLIVGAGFGGLLFAVRLIQAGIPAHELRIVDSAGGFGGTWYWNRYPGVMCDIESYIYMPLLEEMEYMPKHKYAYGSELREYAEAIADRWELKDKALFRTEAKSMNWDDDKKEWVVKMESVGKTSGNPVLTIRSQFVIMASGILNNAKLPGISGIEIFRGHSFHTSRWDYNFTGGSPTDADLINLKDKKVGIIGTGATTIQVVPPLAQWTKELYVFQRTPSSVDERCQRPTDVAWWVREIKGKKGWQKDRMENFNACVTNVSPPPAVDMVADQWTKIPSYVALIGGPIDVSMATVRAHVESMHTLDLPRAERIRARVDRIVQDKGTADRLKHWYPSWCKRPCFHDDYLPSFNRPNVHLVDTDGKGVDYITERGVMVAGSEFELDLLIFSTGFSAPGVGSPPSAAGISVIGRNNCSMDKKWNDSIGTLHGVTSHGFPNLFWPGPIQAAAAANQTFVLDQLSTHVSYILSQSVQNAIQKKQEGFNRLTIEPTVEAEEEWSMRILQGAASFAAVAGCTPGYMNREAQGDRMTNPEENMKAARGLIWGKGIAHYVKVLEDWREHGGMKGLDVVVAT
ncbi:flavin-binding monooxygenase-like family protein [Lepidopterella palustris CBS 459.81]|uniref:Flavin-binding monooxygenase-like family protein n=1 Tax=Lepidopterella palustris CBS 459.81 TaxID=1314670 RepID=A0A8E2EAW4_9PEZI|nr:flavin-binding monooxygenase-like family protein [Lepidopterella palustris CBS 459.81]